MKLNLQTLMKMLIWMLRREANANKRRTMNMWRNAIDHTCETRPMEEIHKLIDRQPKVVQTIIDCEGGRSGY